MNNELDFESWVESVPKRLSYDPLWKSTYYRLAMYLYDLSWQDAGQLKHDFRGREIAKQLINCAGSISANMEEAYGRGVGTSDYRRILRVALGEARETQGWYLRARHILPSETIEHRLDIVNQIISLLVKAVSKQVK